MLRTEKGELWLEPARGQAGESGLERPHIVFKRSAAQGNKKRKRKKKKKHEKNCGTRGKCRSHAQDRKNLPCTTLLP